MRSGVCGIVYLMGIAGRGKGMGNLLTGDFCLVARLLFALGGLFGGWGWGKGLLWLWFLWFILQVNKRDKNTGL